MVGNIKVGTRVDIKAELLLLKLIQLFAREVFISNPCWKSKKLRPPKAKLLQEGIFFLIHLFARAVLVMKKLETDKTNPAFIISVLLYARWSQFLRFPTFLLIKFLWQING
jgi:hypothetical protein